VGVSVVVAVGVSVIDCVDAGVTGEGVSGFGVLIGV